jgi:hypothetical protein
MIRRLTPAFLIVIAANVAMLAGVAVNRSGPPEAVVTLTERELRLPMGTSDRDTARRLDMRYNSRGRPALSWLTPDKLAALGFDVSAPPSQPSRVFYARQLPRRVFVVLEYDGPAWQNHLRELRRLQAERAEQMEAVRRGERDIETLTDRFGFDIGAEETQASRLMMIDAAVDPAALRRVYPDRQKQIILPATVRVYVEDTTPGGINPTGMISLATGSVIVPRAWRGVLDAVGPPLPNFGVLTAPPRFGVTLAYGARFEPWIVSIETLDASAPP